MFYFIKNKMKLIAIICRIIYIVSMIYCMEHAKTTKEDLMILVLIMSVCATTYFICQGYL